MEAKQAIAAVDAASKSPQSLTKGDLTLTNGTANSESLIADYKADVPLVLDTRPESIIRMVLTAYDGFDTDASNGNQETFSLSQDIVDSPNTDPFVLYEDGAAASEDSGTLSFANDQFKYTDDAANNRLHAFYTAADPVSVTIKKVAPAAESSVDQTVYSGNLGLTNTRDQFERPLGWDISRSDNPLKAVVPSKWTLEVYANGPYAVAWDDGLDGSQVDDVAASNALLSLPVAQCHERIDGLSGAVRRSITA